MKKIKNMKKILSIFTLSLFLLSGLAVSAAARELLYIEYEAIVNDPVADFLKKDWSKDNLYPEWYAGRYFNDDMVMIYVVTAGQEHTLPEGFQSKYSYVVKKYSFNELKKIDTEITDIWMGKSKGKSACMQGIGIDESENRVHIWLYEENNRTPLMRAMLKTFYGDMVSIENSDWCLLSTHTETQIVPQNNPSQWVLLVLLVAVSAIAVTALVLRRKHYRYATQTSSGGTAELSGSLSTAETELKINQAWETPGDSVFVRIMKDIE